jgi:aspartyl-tRNA(Asn)/glutamyl-tRNA(Gln) amidotransferase subunit A
VDLSRKTAYELAESFRKEGASQKEMLDALRKAVADGDGRLNAYVKFSETQPHHRKAGKDAPLLGVPVAIKDNICVEGQEASCASKILQGFVAPYHATVIEKLLAAGAVVYGRTNMDEFAFGSSCETSFYGPTGNPRRDGAVPGGSSGGSAAAVAAHLAVAALGSDTGGSIRQPAAFCGIVGIKPTYGRVSRYGLVAFASSLDQIGPLTKDVRDAALLLKVIAGHDERDSTSADVPVPDYLAELKKDVKGLRIGMPDEYLAEGVSPEVRKAVTEDAVKAFTAMGARVERVSLPHTRYCVPVYYIVAPSEASSNLARFDGVRYGLRDGTAASLGEMYERTRGAGFGPEAKRRILLGTYSLSSGYYDAYYLKAMKVRTRIRQDFEEAFKKVDVLMTPTAPTVAFRFGEKSTNPLEMYLSDICTISANLAGVPAISVPCGRGAEGLPIGLQLLAKPFDEGTLFRAAHAFEQATGHHRLLGNVA